MVAEAKITKTLSSSQMNVKNISLENALIYPKSVNSLNLLPHTEWIGWTGKAMFILKHGKHWKVKNKLSTKYAYMHAYTHVESKTKISTHSDDFDERKRIQTNQSNKWTKRTSAIVTSNDKAETNTYTIRPFTSLTLSLSIYCKS